jgi:hypothetical protein
VALPLSFDGKEKMLSLGMFPGVTIATARTRRDEARATLAEGTDPARRREADKLAASISASNTFGVVAIEYIARLVAKARPTAPSRRTAGFCKSSRGVRDRFALLAVDDLLDEERKPHLENACQPEPPKW